VSATNHLSERSILVLLGLLLPLQPVPAQDVTGQDQQEEEVMTRPLVVMGVGDIMMGTDFPLNHLPDDDGVSFFAGVSEILRSADITFGNLEQVLMNGGEPVKTCTDPAACFLFRSPTRYAEHLKAAGFDVMSVANNHARDFGEEGRDASMAALDAAGIYHSGREDTFASWEIDDRKIALMAFAPFIGSSSPLGPDLDRARRNIAALVESHDIVIISLHGGGEGADANRVPFEEEYYRGELRGDVAAFSRAMVDIGADLIIGHGPHVPRGMEIYKGRLIAYSLGNFATYYGISVAGIKGLAPVLEVRLNADGSLLDGRIISTIQLRPGGPYPDRKKRAYQEIKRLTMRDFCGGGIEFSDDGYFVPADTPDNSSQQQAAKTSP
jgi:poly-gamma-glutamate capsule biosynthesis protein CapA/YwtB (metallophosphatase superfamily)